MTNRLAPSWRKTTVVLIFTAVWITVNFALMRPMQTPTSLDESWQLGLATMLQHGAIAGRDFQFTYGPLAQLLAWFGTLPVLSHSAFDAFPLMLFVCSSASAVFLAIAVSLMKPLNWVGTAIVYLFGQWMNLFFGFTQFRLTLLLLGAVLVHRTVAAKMPKRQIAWAAALGLFCVFEQLATVELGMYAVAGALCVFAIFAFWVRDPKRAAVLALTMLATFAAANIAISIAFKLTSSEYQFLFDYQHYAIETVRGYFYTAGVAWEMSRLPTLVLLVAAGFTTLSAFATLRKRPFDEASLPVSLAIVSLLSARSSMARSDVGHIIYAFTPFLVTFLVIGQGWLIRPKRPTLFGRYGMQAAWVLFLIVILAVWPLTNTGTLRAAGTFFSEPQAMMQIWRGIRQSHVPPETVLPVNFLNVTQSSSGRLMLAFPYDDYIPVLLNRPILAPVLLSHNAATVALQGFYVDRIEKERQPFDVEYSADGISVWPIDGVQAVSRSPQIFEYLYRHFQLAPGQKDDQGLVLLRKATQPRTLTFDDREFSFSGSSAAGVVHMRATEPCGLVQIELKMQYSSMLWRRPNAVQMTFQKNDHDIYSTDIRPIAANEYFKTYVSLIRPASFLRIFGNESLPASEWDSIRYAPDPSDWMGANPSHVDVRRVQCLDSRRFIADTPVPDILDAGFELFPEFLSGVPKSGYFTVDPAVGDAPRVSAKLESASSPGEVLELAAPPLAIDVTIDIRTASIGAVGVAITNAAKSENTIQIALEDPSGAAIEQKEIKLSAGNQVTHYLTDLFPDVSRADTLRLRSDLPFAALALRLGTMKAGQLLMTVTKPVDSSETIFPQFVMGGGWASAVVLYNPSSHAVSGVVHLRTSANNPFRVSMNGMSNSDFLYAINAGRTLQLVPGRQ